MNTIGLHPEASRGNVVVADLSGSDGIPLYVRVAMSLRTRILQGEFKVGDRLPPFEEIASAYGVALNTVRKAIQVMAAESLVASGRGSGTVVTAASVPGLPTNLRATIRDPLALSRDVEIQILSSETTDTLSPELVEGYPLASRYQRVQKTHNLRGSPFALLDIFVDHAIYRRFPPAAEHTLKLSQLLRDHGRAKVVTSREELTISHADQRVSALLRYPIAGPIVRLRRWRMIEGGTVVYACVALYRSDLFVWDTTVAEPSADHFGHHIIPEVKTAERRRMA